MTALLIDRVLPRSDFAVMHTGVFRTPPEECFRAARRLDLMEHPVVRTLVTVRSLPRRAQRPRSLRIDDMVAPPLHWLTLAERPGTELVLGQISRPWATRSQPPIVPRGADEYVEFDRPGFAKIAVSLRVEPYEAARTLLTVETRVALTDPGSADRFRRYWLLVRPLRGLIRRIAFRQLARESASPRIQGTIWIDRPVEVVFDTVADERNEPRYNPRLSYVEQTTPGPVGVGTRFHAEAATMGRTIPMTIEFTEFDRPRRLASATHLRAMDVHGVVSFAPTPHGTRMSWSWDIQAHGPLALLRPVVVRLGRRQEQAVWQGLKRYLERGHDRHTGPVRPMWTVRAGQTYASTPGRRASSSSTCSTTGMPPSPTVSGVRWTPW